jgi:hypothetical protein
MSFGPHNRELFDGIPESQGPKSMRAVLTGRSGMGVLTVITNRAGSQLMGGFKG